jgi:hypothetical protein
MSDQIFPLEKKLIANGISKDKFNTLLNMKIIKDVIKNQPKKRFKNKLLLIKTLLSTTKFSNFFKNFNKIRLRQAQSYLNMLYYT